MWYEKKVTVIFPAYNEEMSITDAVRSFLELTDSGGAKVVDSLLVIDNNSRDRTAELAQAAGAQVIRETKQGYGNALKRGLLEAKGDYLVLCEPDGTFVAKDLLKILSYAEEFELVCGTRTTRELIWSQANMGWFLRLGNWVVAKALQALYGTCSLSDCGCTYRLIRASARDQILPYLHVGKSHFLPNVIIAARIKRLTMIEIPIIYRSRIGESKITGTKLGTFKTGFAMIFLILSSWPVFLWSRLRR
jgi:glycosyltransferase involved in cell wall biosynthesis